MKYSVIEEQELEERNVLIAEYIGYKFYPYIERDKREVYSGWWVNGSDRKKKTRIINHFLGKHNKDLIFHRDWNYIMKAWVTMKKEMAEQNARMYLNSLDNLYDGDIRSLFICLSDYIKTKKKLSNF